MTEERKLQLQAKSIYYGYIRARLNNWLDTEVKRKENKPSVLSYFMIHFNNKGK